MDPPPSKRARAPARRMSRCSLPHRAPSSGSSPRRDPRPRLHGRRSSGCCSGRLHRRHTRLVESVSWASSACRPATNAASSGGPAISPALSTRTGRSGTSGSACSCSLVASNASSSATAARRCPGDARKCRALRYSHSGSSLPSRPNRLVARSAPVWASSGAIVIIRLPQSGLGRSVCGQRSNCSGWEGSTSTSAAVSSGCTSAKLRT